MSNKNLIAEIYLDRNDIVNCIRYFDFTLCCFLWYFDALDFNVFVFDSFSMFLKIHSILSIAIKINQPGIFIWPVIRIAISLTLQKIIPSEKSLFVLNSLFLHRATISPSCHDYDFCLLLTLEKNYKTR